MNREVRNKKWKVEFSEEVKKNLKIFQMMFMKNLRK